MKTCVLGAGTEIGKTHVACALLRRARAQGLSVNAVKPVMSGYSPDAFTESDAGLLLNACGESPSRENLSRVCLHAFEAPLAPNVAARKAGVTLDYEAILAFAHSAACEKAEVFLVEGVGGVLSPLTDTHFNADLAADLDLPAILVTANYLGAVSHTLTAIETLERRGVKLAAIAVSQPCEEFADPQELARELARWTDAPCVPFQYDRTGRACEEAADRMLSLLQEGGAF